MGINAVLRGGVDRAMVPRAMTAERHISGKEGTAPALEPDFRHVRHWVFDLDNTLYDTHCGVFAQIERRMTDYVVRHTGLPRNEARALQKSLYREYGTTLNGMMRRHGVVADDYLSFVHDIDLSALTPDPKLTAAVASLPGRRYIFTNGCRRHAERILSRIGMDHLFETVWDIRTLGFTPKPDPAAYDLVVAASGLPPRAAAMFDDIPHNLAAAQALGMTTVWLDTGMDFSHGGALPRQDHIDHTTSDLASFLHAIRT